MGLGMWRVGMEEGRDGGVGVGGMGISGHHARPDQQSWLHLPDTVAQQQQ